MKTTSIAILSIFAVAIFTYTYFDRMFNDLAEPLLFEPERVTNDF